MAPSDKTPPFTTELERIYHDPHTAYALDLDKLFREKKLTRSGLNAFLDSLPAEAAAERAKLETLLNNPNASVTADLSTRTGQLVWTAGLGFAFQNSPPKTIRAHPVWKTLTRHPQMVGSLGTAARYVDMSITNRNATMDWGVPGSWFWFSPDKNHINIDLFHTLLLGFGEAPAPGMKGLAHATAVMMHEVGHAQFTTRFTDAMISLKKREDVFLKEKKSRKLTPEEFKEFTRVQKELKLRLSVFNAAEDNCVNRFAANQSRHFPHDFSTSLNMCNVILQGSGAYMKGVERGELHEKETKDLTQKQKDIHNAQEALARLKSAMAKAFYTSNGLFDAADIAAWKKLGIDPDTIKGADGSTFDDLLDACIGIDGLAHLQPAERERWLLRNIFTSNVQSYAERRCKLIEEIWDKYAAPHAQILIDAAEENAEQKMDQKKKSNQQKNENPQPSDDNDQQPPSQDDSDSDSSPEDSGDSPSSEKGEKQQSPEKSSGNGQGSGTEDQQDSSEETSPSSGSSGDEDENSSDTADVDGAGDMEIDDPSPETPEDARKAERQDSEEDIDEDAAKTVRDLAHDAKQQERKDAAQDASKNNQKNNKDEDDKAPDLNMAPIDKGASQKGVDLKNLSRGDWHDFRKRINEMEPVIARVAQDFIYIRDKQKQLVRNISKQKEKLPRGGDIRQRLDMRSHMNFSVKRTTGQKIEETDLQRWKKDEITTETTNVELWILGDGSGSMACQLPDGIRRIDSAVQSMAILFEAGKRAQFDTFVGMWGDDHIRIIAAPGDTDQKIGDNFQRVKNGINSGTQLSPAFKQAIQHSAKQETNAQGKSKRFSGMTHFLIISDGDLDGSDTKPLKQMILSLFRYGPAVSVDVAILGGGANTAMHKVVADVKKEFPAATIDTLNADSAKDIPILLAKKIKQRFERAAKEVPAVPDAQKREAFAQVSKLING